MTRFRFTRPRPVRSVVFALALGATPFLTAGAELTAKLVDAELSRVNRVRQLPEQVALAVSALLGGQSLADPEHLERSAAPTKSVGQARLIFAAKAPTLWAVHFSPAGEAKGYDLAIIEVEQSGDIVAISHLVSTERAWSIPNLKNMVRRGQFKSASAAGSR